MKKRRSLLDSSEEIRTIIELYPRLKIIISLAGRKTLMILLDKSATYS
jgi:hypothetical protein